jgi:phage FluMu protein Com
VGPVADHFGARDQIECSRCKGVMAVVRRMPDPIRGATFEFQTLECSKCGRVQTRTVGADGKPPV